MHSAENKHLEVSSYVVFKTRYKNIFLKIIRTNIYHYHQNTIRMVQVFLIIDFLFLIIITYRKGLWKVKVLTK